MLKLQTERRGNCLEPTNAKLIADPLTFLAEDHLRQRQICAMLIAIANDPVPEFRAMGLSLAYLRHEFLLHNADERSGLFPLLQERCEPEDEIDIILSRLQDDHDSAQDNAHAVCLTLETLIETKEAPTPDERVFIKAFATKVQRYIIWENAIILRLASVRLLEDDLAKLAEQMLLRRGLVEPKM